MWSQVSWALGSTAVNKASGGDGIPLELFKTLLNDQSVALNMSANMRPQDWKKSVLIPVPKKGCTKECSNHQTIALISRASKIMLKILHARLQHYVNQELPGIQAEFRKGRETRDQIANIHWIIEKAREFQKNI